MTDKPTIEEAKVRLAHAVRWAFKGHADVREADLRTLLASHASLEEWKKEAKRLTQPFAVLGPQFAESVPDDYRVMGRNDPTVGDLRALAAFVNEKERT